MTRNSFYAALDVGGTYIKYTLVSPKMQIVSSVGAEAVPSLLDAEDIFNAFRNVAKKLTNAAVTHNGEVSRICVAICGPMDYERGIFQMNEDKYSSVYGVDLKEKLHEFFGNKSIPVHTAHDVRSFLLGNSVIDPALQNGRVMALTLGTGIGSAFMLDGRILLPEIDDIPEKGLGRQPYGNGKVEEIIGGEALRKLYPGGQYSVKELEFMARKGDTTAYAVFHKLGAILGETASQLVNMFRPDIIILGGQISRSADLFMPDFRHFINTEVKCVPDMERAAMLGAVSSCLKSLSDQSKSNSKNL